MSQPILLEVSGGIATITLNRPDKLNAFDLTMREPFIRAIDRVRKDHDVRVLVVTGAGRGFCAGGDVRFMADLKQRDSGYEGLAPLVETGREALTLLADLPFPTLAAVNGPAAGGGINLALACDLRIASDRATFGQTFVRIGLHADWGGTYHLPRLVGLARALELCWLGDMIDAAEAWRIGLVNRVVAQKSFAAEARALAVRLADAPATSVRLAKRALRASFHRTLEQCFDAESEAQEECWNSPDSREGILAFAEKRTARFGSDALPAEAVRTRFE
jgi:2-(1,2-epoxy-1,2-dihydrophenyl)acetyl-CoA isomerase